MTLHAVYLDVYTSNVIIHFKCVDTLVHFRMFSAQSDTTLNVMIIKQIQFSLGEKVLEGLIFTALSNVDVSNLTFHEKPTLSCLTSFKF